MERQRLSDVKPLAIKFQKRAIDILSAKYLLHRAKTGIQSNNTEINSEFSICYSEAKVLLHKLASLKANPDISKLSKNVIFADKEVFANIRKL